MFSAFIGDAKKVSEVGKDASGLVPLVSFFRDGEKVKDGEYCVIPRPITGGKDGPSFGGKNGSGRRIGSALKPIRAWLPLFSTATSAAGAALAGTFNLVPANAQDWASYAAVYDEVRLVRGTCHFNFQASPAANGAFVSTEAVVGFDPADGTALTSIIDGLTYAQHAGPFQVQPGPYTALSGSTVANSPLATSRTGFHSFGFHNLKGSRSAHNTAQATWIFGDWGATSDAGDVAGFLKLYLNAQASGTVGYRMYIRLECEFRSRR